MPSFTFWWLCFKASLWTTSGSQTAYSQSGIALVAPSPGDLRTEALDQQTNYIIAVVEWNPSLWLSECKTGANPKSVFSILYHIFNYILIFTWECHNCQVNCDIITNVAQSIVTSSQEHTQTKCGTTLMCENCVFDHNLFFHHVM